MLWTLIRKELLHHLLTARCALSLLVLLVATPVSVGILVHDFQLRQADYNRRQADLDHYMKHYAHFNRIGTVLDSMVPPAPFEILVRGLSDRSSLDQLHNDPLPVIFPMVDLVFIVTILGSLTVLIFTYDAVGGEKEEGTLKLVLSNRVSRAMVLLSKLLAVWLAVGASFLVSLGLGLLLIVLQPEIGWGGSDWTGLLLLVAGVMAYLFFFTALGMLISAWHRTSTTAMMSSLCVWVLLVQLLPNLSPYLASVLIPLPSRIQTEKRIAPMLDTERDRLVDALWKERRRELTRRYPVLVEEMSGEERKRRIDSDPEYRKIQALVDKVYYEVIQEVNKSQTAKVDVILDALKERQRAQTEMARNLSLASPSACFAYMATDLADTGLRNIDGIHEQEEAWQDRFKAYKDQRIRRMMEENPREDAFNVATDMSDRPRFQYRPPGLGERFSAMWLPFALLGGSGLFLFLGAHLAFRRYDVR